MTGAQQAGLALAAVLAAVAITSSRGKRARRPAPDGVDPRRGAVVDAAMGEVGALHPDRYWAEALPPGTDPLPPVTLEWCGAFALWAIKQAGLAPGIYWKFGRGFASRLPMTTDPQPGDVVYFDQHQHHAIVARVEGNEVVTVDGNQPDVRVRRRLKSAAAGYFSIAPLLDAPGEGVLA